MYIVELSVNRKIHFEKVKNLPLLYDFKRGYYSIKKSSQYSHKYRKYQPIFVILEGRTNSYNSANDNASFNALYQDLDIHEMSKGKVNISFQWIRHLRTMFKGFVTYFGLFLILIFVLYAFIG